MTPAATLIRAARAQAGLTQAELAARLGVTQAAVARLERPQSNPRLSTLARVIAATGQQLELTAVPHKPSVDETLLAMYVRMTPAERLRAFKSSYDSLQRIRNAVEAAGGGGS